MGFWFSIPPRWEASVNSCAEALAGVLIWVTGSSEVASGNLTFFGKWMLWQERAKSTFGVKARAPEKGRFHSKN